MAHELAHLSKKHGRFSGWIYRIRASWFRLMETLDQKEAWGTFLFKWFFEWFVPRFNAYSFVLAREDEYVADREAAKIVGAGSMGSALVRISALGRKIGDDFWNPFYMQAYHQEDCMGPFAELKKYVQAGLKESVLNRTLKEVALEKTGYVDTHPSLSDRLQAIGAVLEAPKPLDESASSFYLKQLELQLVETLDKEWIEHNYDIWSRHYEEGQQMKEELAASGQPETYEAAIDYLKTIEKLHGTKAFIDAFFAMRKQVPEIEQDYELKYYVATLLLEEGDKQAVELLEEVKDQHWEVKLRALQALRYYYTLYGTEEHVSECEEELNKWFAVLEKADEEMVTINFECDYQPSDDEQLKMYYAREVANVEDIIGAYLVKRTLTTLPGKVVYYLIIEGKSYLLKSDLNKLRQKLLNELHFPYETFVGMIELDPIFKQLVEHVEGCQIYKKEKKKNRLTV